MAADIRTPVAGAGGKPDAKWQGWNDGQRLEWYARDVGPVKLEFRHANGRVTRVKLVSHKVRRAGSRYFPDGIGSVWHFQWRDGRGKLLCREFWRLVTKQGKMRYLGCGLVQIR